MKTIYSILIFVTVCVSTMAQTNVLYVDVADYGLAPQGKVNCTLTLLSPLNRTVNGIAPRNDPMGRTSNTNGRAYWTNIVWGKYRLDVAGFNGTQYTLYVGTNTLGLWNMATLITNSAAIPPNSATNFLTEAQTLALIAPLQNSANVTNDYQPILNLKSNLYVGGFGGLLNVFVNSGLINIAGNRILLNEGNGNGNFAGSVTAGEGFNGDLTGNADTATIADTATSAPSGRALDGIIGAATNVALSLTGITGSGSVVDNVLNLNLTGAASGLTNGAFNSTLNAETKILQMPDVIRLVGNVYGVCVMTNQFRNSAGTAGYAGNAVVTNGADVDLIISNTFKALSGKSIVIDTSFSTPAADERAILSDASGTLPPNDKQTRNLAAWLRGSSAYTHKRTISILAGQNAQLEAMTLTAAQSFAVITNLAAITQASGDAVVIATPFLNYTYYGNITNGSGAGPNVSNYMATVTNQTAFQVWDIYKFLWPYTATNTFNNLPWTVDGYHPASYQWQLLATNLFYFIATNQALSQQLSVPLAWAVKTNESFQGYSMNNGFVNRYNDTNFHIAFSWTTNGANTGGVKTNGYLDCNLTYSNLPPCTSFKWEFFCRCSQSQNAGQRLNIVTDYTVSQWSANYTLNNFATVNFDWANSLNYGNQSNSIVLGNKTGTGISGGAFQAGTFSDIVMKAEGYFTTGTNITAVQVLIGNVATNTGSTFVDAHLYVTPAPTKTAAW